jgi:hypothetical protein
MFTFTLKSKKRAIYYGFLKVERSQKIVFKLNFFSTPSLQRFTHSAMSAWYDKKIVGDGSSNGYHCKLYFPCTQIFICFSWTSIFSLHTKTYLFNINLRLYLKPGTSIPNNKFTVKISKYVITNNQSSGRQTYTPWWQCWEGESPSLVCNLLAVLKLYQHFTVRNNRPKTHNTIMFPLYSLQVIFYYITFYTNEGKLINS